MKHHAWLVNKVSHYLEKGVILRKVKDILREFHSGLLLLCFYPQFNVYKNGFPSL